MSLFNFVSVPNLAKLYTSLVNACMLLMIFGFIFNTEEKLKKAKSDDDDKLDFREFLYGSDSTGKDVIMFDSQF